MYRAKDTQTGALVAVKHLKPEAVAHDASLVQRFTREAEALRQLDHPNIVKVLMENRKQIHTLNESFLLRMIALWVKMKKTPHFGF